MKKNPLRGNPTVRRELVEQRFRRIGLEVLDYAEEKSPQIKTTVTFSIPGHERFGGSNKYYYYCVTVDTLNEDTSDTLILTDRITAILRNRSRQFFKLDEIQSSLYRVDRDLKDDLFKLFEYHFFNQNDERLLNEHKKHYENSLERYIQEHRKEQTAKELYQESLVWNVVPL